jgi:hypothetical protein
MNGASIAAVRVFARDSPGQSLSDLIPILDAHVHTKQLSGKQIFYSIQQYYLSSAHILIPAPIMNYTECMSLDHSCLSRMDLI